MSHEDLTIRLEAGISGDMLDFPWEMPLARWPEELIIPLPRGISRHVVRFVDVDGTVMALKEIAPEFAEREFRLLRALEELDIPAVHGVGVVTGRTDASGEPLPGVLVTEHLTWSIPYRNVYARTLRPDTMDRLLDALVLLLVRLHLVGFAWNDCSLSNVLFRRDADAFAAYLVDAETGELHERLSRGQRLNDIDIAHFNIAGGLLDLQAGGRLSPDLDAIATGGEFLREQGYQRVWGIGRHIQGSQIFDYWRDPDRLMFEHFADGDRFDCSVETGWSPMSTSGLAQWGPPVSRDFLGTKPNPALVAAVLRALAVDDNDIDPRTLRSLMKAMSA